MKRRSRKSYTVLEIAQGKMPHVEKVIEHAGDKFMEQLGFTSIHFSQPRASMQTPGIPDRRYYRIGEAPPVWWEAKAEDGQQTEAQFKFQILAELCGETYLLGTHDVLVEWAAMGYPRAFTDDQRDRLQPEKFRYIQKK